METTITFLFKLSQFELDTYCLNYKNSEKPQGVVNEDSVGFLKGKLFSMIDECVYKGEKIKAVKIYREATGADLATAKRIVDERFKDFDLQNSNIQQKDLHKTNSFNNINSKPYSVIDKRVDITDVIQRSKNDDKKTSTISQIFKKSNDEENKIDSKKTLDKNDSRYNDYLTAYESYSTFLYEFEVYEMKVNAFDGSSKDKYDNLKHENALLVNKLWRIECYFAKLAGYGVSDKIYSECLAHDKLLKDMAFETERKKKKYLRLKYELDRKNGKQVYLQYNEYEDIVKD